MDRGGISLFVICLLYVCYMFVILFVICLLYVFFVFFKIDRGGISLFVICLLYVWKEVHQPVALSWSASQRPRRLRVNGIPLATMLF
jgi:uncharacterized RDD family membrane protein YckC